MSLSRKVARQSTLQVAGRLYTAALAFAITALILPRHLDDASFGVVAFYITLFMLLTNVLDFGAGQIVVREASRRREEADELAGMLVGLKARIAAVGVALVAAVAFAFDGAAGATTWLAIAGALGLLAHAPAGLAAILQVDMRFRPLVVAQALGQTSWLVVTVALVALGVREPGAFVVAFGTAGVVYGAATWRAGRDVVSPRFGASRARRAWLWRESWPAGVAASMATIYFYVDTLMLRPLLGDDAVAHYASAYRVMTFLLMVPVLFSQVIFPVYSRLWPAEPGAFGTVLTRTTRFLFALGVLVAATLPWVADEVVAAVFPPSYAPGGPALGVLALATVWVFIAYPHVLALLAAGGQRTQMVISTSGVVVNVALNLALVPRIGIVGAAWATVATEAFIATAAGVALRRRTGLTAGVSAFARPLLCGAAASGALAWCVGSAWWGSWPDAARIALGVGVGVVGVAASGTWPLRLGVETGGPAGEGA